MRFLSLLMIFITRAIWGALLAQSTPIVQGVSYSKGRIEWRLNDSLDKTLAIMDYAFLESEKTLRELERNLIYKTNNKIYFAAYFDYTSYFNDQRNRAYLFEKNRSKQQIKLVGTVYEPILVGANKIDVRFQIRKAVARQFLNEYLFGFHFYEKFNHENQQSVPDWLKDGFIEYFAEGLNQEELLLFKQLHQEGCFKNLNFINKQDEILFGKVLWYWFELEKGNDAKSVFWSLIKYVQSFDISFEYQYGIEFRDWLRFQLARLEKKQRTSKNGEFQIEQHRTGDRGKHFDFLLSTGDYLHEKLSQDRHFYSFGNINHNQSQTIWKSKFNPVYPFPDFNIASFKLDESGTNSWYGIIWDRAWYLVRNNSSIKHPLPVAANYRILSVQNNTLTVSLESKGEYRIMRINGLSGKVIDTVFNSNNGAKILPYLFAQENSFIYLELEHVKDEFYNRIINHVNKDYKTLFESKISTPAQSYNQLVFIDSNHFSLLKNDPVENAVFHFSRKNAADTFGIQKTAIRGLYFQQYDLWNDSFLELYSNQNVFQVNILSKYEPIFDQDTFIRRDIKPQFIDSPLSTKPRLFSKDRYFVPPFQKPEKTQKRIIPFYRNREQTWKSNLFRNWFFVHQSNLHLDNKEISALYDAMVSPLNQYNSALTFYFENTLSDAAAKNRLDFLLFSNANRRRIGLQVQHRYIFTHDLSIESEFSYRLRQFKDLSLSNLRNRSLLGSIEIAKNNDFDYRFSIGLNYQQSQIIPINNDPEKVHLPVITQSWWNLPLSIKKTMHFRNNGIVQMTSGLNFGAIFKQNSVLTTNDIYFHANGEKGFSVFLWKASMNGRYSFTKQNITYVMGGTTGWISSIANTDVQFNELEANSISFLKGGLPIRGLPYGSRIGNSYFHVSQDIGFPLLRLFPNSLKETHFWRSIHLYGFFDAGLAFFDESPYHFSNPYNRIRINNPNYILVASSRKNPWLMGYGYGVQFSILGYPFRLEYAYAYEGREKVSPRLLLSLGKNF